MTPSRVGVVNRRRCTAARFLSNGRRYLPLESRGAVTTEILVTREPDVNRRPVP